MALDNTHLRDELAAVKLRVLRQDPSEREAMDAGIIAELRKQLAHAQSTIAALNARPFQKEFQEAQRRIGEFKRKINETADYVDRCAKLVASDEVALAAVDALRPLNNDDV
jgi:hypothetical protein